MVPHSNTTQCAQLQQSYLKKIEQTIPYNRTFNIIGCIKYDRPNYDLAIYWGTKNMVIIKPVSNYILMNRTFYVVFSTSCTGGQTRITGDPNLLPSIGCKKYHVKSSTHWDIISYRFSNDLVFCPPEDC